MPRVAPEQGGPDPGRSDVTSSDTVVSREPPGGGVIVVDERERGDAHQRTTRCSNGHARHRPREPRGGLRNWNLVSACVAVRAFVRWKSSNTRHGSTSLTLRPCVLTPMSQNAGYAAIAAERVDHHDERSSRRRMCWPPVGGFWWPPTLLVTTRPRQAQYSLELLPSLRRVETLLLRGCRGSNLGGPVDRLVLRFWGETRGEWRLVGR